MAADIVLTICGLTIWRFSRVLRPFVLATRKRGAKEVLKNVASSIPDQGKLIVGISSVIFLWAFMGFVIFHEHDGQRDGKFGSVAEAIENMAVVFLSASYNQQLMESQPESSRPVAAFFFVSFLLVCNMFLLKLVSGNPAAPFAPSSDQKRELSSHCLPKICGLRRSFCAQITAVAFGSFAKFAQQERLSVLGARKEALDRAFNLVATSGLSDGKPTMSLTSFVAVMGFADQHAPTSSLAGATNHGLTPVRRSPLSLSRKLSTVHRI